MLDVNTVISFETKIAIILLISTKNVDTDNKWLIYL